jgi:hypothetical protein
MFQVNHLIGFGAFADDALVKSVTFLEHIDTGSTSDNQSETMDFGAEPGAGETRLLVIAAGTTGVTNVGNVVIGGVSATIIGPAIEGATFEFLAYAEVPTGISGTVSFSWSGGPSVDTGIGIWRVMNVTETPFDTATDDITDPLDVSLNVPANGIVIASSFAVNGTGITFNGLANEDFEVDVSGSNERHAGASELFASAQTPLSLTISNPNSPTDNVGVAASWG